jgi:hypothetical protein
VIIEVHDLDEIIARCEACLFCHEHTIYLSRLSMARLMERAGLRLVSVDLVPENERRGNSLLVVGVHADNSNVANVPNRAGANQSPSGSEAIHQQRPAGNAAYPQQSPSGSEALGPPAGNTAYPQQSPSGSEALGPPAGNTAYPQQSPSGSEAIHQQRPLLENWEAYRDFALQVETAHRHLADHVHDLIRAGKRVAGYGASARAISTLSLAGLTSEHIAYVCDANPSLHGKYLPKSHVPIRPPEHGLRDPVDEVIVFAYGYMDEIRAALRPYTEQGGRLVSLLDLLRPPASGTES